MLKFIKYHMESISGIEIYPLISFMIFFVFFILLTLYVIGMDKKEIGEITKLPLDDNSAEI